MSLLGRTTIEIITLPSKIISQIFWKRAALFQLIYSLAGLVFGLACIIGGIVLFFHGVTGSTSWTSYILGLKSVVSDAAPGVILFIIGLFVVLITRYGIKIRK